MIGRLALGTIVSLCLLGCSSGESDPAGARGDAGTDAPSGTLTENDRWLAARLYEDQTCAMCHGESGAGGELGPALDRLTPYWNEARLAEYLQDPEAFTGAHPDFDDRSEQEYSMKMPAYANLTEGDRRLLSRWLLERSESR